MTVEIEQNWYFTFGYGHKYPNCYTVIYGNCFDGSNLGHILY